MDARDFWIAAYLVALHKIMPAGGEMDLGPKEAQLAASLAGAAANEALTQYENAFGVNAG